MLHPNCSMQYWHKEQGDVERVSNPVTYRQAAYGKDKLVSRVTACRGLRVEVVHGAVCDVLGRQRGIGTWCHCLWDTLGVKDFCSLVDGRRAMINLPGLIFLH